MKKTQIFHFEFGCKLPLTLINEMFLSSEEQVINIENQNQRLVMNNLYVKIGISYALGKSKTPQIVVYSSIPLKIGKESESVRFETFPAIQGQPDMYICIKSNLLKHSEKINQ